MPEGSAKGGGQLAAFSLGGPNLAEMCHGKRALSLTCNWAVADSIFCLAWSAVEEDIETDMFCLSHLISSHIQDSCKIQSTIGRGQEWGVGREKGRKGE